MEDKEDDDQESVEKFEWNNVSKLKMRSFIRYLEDHKSDFWWYYNKIIETYKERLSGQSKEDFEAQIELVGSPIISDSDDIVINGMNRDLFLNKSKIILEFLWRSWDKREQLEKLFKKMSGDGKKRSVEDLGFNGLKHIFLDILKFEKKGNEWIGSIKGVPGVVTIHEGWLKSVFSESNKNELQNLKKLYKQHVPTGVYGQIKDLERFLLDSRVNDINSAFEEIFGITVPYKDDTKDMTDCKLLESMFIALAWNVESLRKKPEKDINSMVDKAKKERLWWTQAEEYISHELELILKDVFDSQIKDCSENIKEWWFVDSIKTLKENIRELKELLEDCFDSDEFNGLKDRINGVQNDYKPIEDAVKSIYERYEMYKELKEGVYDYNDTKWWPEFNNVKKVICLKELFKCDKLSLDDKFYYCSEILQYHTIKTRNFEHDEILKDILVRRSVGESEDDLPCEELWKLKWLLSNFMKDGEVKEIFDKFGENVLVHKTYLEGKLNGESSVYRIYEVVALAILKMEIELGDNVKDKFKSILKSLWVDDNKVNEIEKLDRILPWSLELYIKKCLSIWAFMFNNLMAVDYNSWEIDFSVIQAWILELMAGKWDGIWVLKYLWFLFNGDNCFHDINNVINNPAFRTTVSQIIKFLHWEGKWEKQGCFSDKYPNEEWWNKFNFTRPNDLMQKKTAKTKFGIWKSSQSFRLAGIRHHGFYIFMKWWPEKHNWGVYDDYISCEANDSERWIFSKLTGEKR